MKRLIISLINRFDRNGFGIKHVRSKKNVVNLERYPLKNVGDMLGPLIVEWMLEKRGISADKKVKKTKHLLSVGSVLQMGSFDATVWGSGMITRGRSDYSAKKSTRRKRTLDFRAVRGPLTREEVIRFGYDCPEVYGDPAILMPLLYDNEVEKKHEVSVVLHYRTGVEGKSQASDPSYSLKLSPEMIKENNLFFIDPKTYDYKWFIDEIRASKLVISSSLHGIILAEAYGVPAIFLNWGMDKQLFKFFDWYSSTGRDTVYCKSVEEALSAEVPAIPDLSSLRAGLMDSFPYDLWDE